MASTLHLSLTAKRFHTFHQWKLHLDARQIFAGVLMHISIVYNQIPCVWPLTSFVWSSTPIERNHVKKYQQISLFSKYIYVPLHQLPVECHNSKVVTHFFKLFVCSEKNASQIIRSTYFTSALITRYNGLNAIDTIAFCISN